MKIPALQKDDVVVLKFSGNAITQFHREGGQIDTVLPYNRQALQYLTEQVKGIYRSVRLVLVTGAGDGNRGAELVTAHPGVFETRDPDDKQSPDADYIGMLEAAKKMKMLFSYLKAAGIPCDLRSELEMPAVCGTYRREQVRSDLRKGMVMGVIPGNPGKSTDGFAVWLCWHLGGKQVLKGTNVDGIYDRDPKNHGAQLMKRVPTSAFSNNGLKQIFDRPGAHDAEGKRIPVRVFNIFNPNNLHDIIAGGRDIGSVIGEYDPPEPSHAGMVS